MRLLRSRSSRAAPFFDTATRLTRRSVGSVRRSIRPWFSNRVTILVIVGADRFSREATSDSDSGPWRSMIARHEPSARLRPPMACWRTIRWRRATARRRRAATSEVAVAALEGDADRS